LRPPAATSFARWPAASASASRTATDARGCASSSDGLAPHRRHGDDATWHLEPQDAFIELDDTLVARWYFVAAARRGRDERQHDDGIFYHPSWNYP
jgi:hypothetical protein